MRIVYLNGSFMHEQDAKVSIFDRAFLMADGVYEVTSVLEGKLVDFDSHLRRLERSLSEVRMKRPAVLADLYDIHRQLVKLNNLHEGLVYLQITRGAPADRDFVFPDAAQTEPTVVLFTQDKPQFRTDKKAQQGLRVISLPDLRWARRDIKTVQLLYPSFAKTAAHEAGVDDAWLVEDDFITEATSSNAYIVIGKAIVTRGLSEEILHGVTRAAVLRFAREHGFEIVERKFSVAEAIAADEAFVTSAAAFVTGVVQIDGKQIGGGQVGPVSRRLRQIYLEECAKKVI